MSGSLGIALIGQRFMGRAHSNAWAQAPKFFDLPVPPRLVSVVARDRALLRRFAQRWGWERYSTDWRVLLEDPEIGLVDIATPNDAHAEPAIALLGAGKHVACEKPLAATLAEARAMKAAAAKSRGKSFVWFNYRRCPAVGLAWGMVKDGALGRLFHVRARYLQSWGGKDTPLLWRFRKSSAGSGAHGDLNAHIIDLARFISGEEIRTVHGAVARTFITRRKIPGTRRTGRSTVDDAVLFLATLSGGGVASFECSRLATGHLNDNTIELNGERGSLRFSFEDMNELWYFDATLPKGTQGWRRIMCTTAGEHPYVAHWWPEAHPLGYEHGFVNMAADILRVVGRRRPELPLPTFADGYETQRVLEAALLSAREGCEVPMREVT